MPWLETIRGRAGRAAIAVAIACACVRAFAGDAPRTGPAAVPALPVPARVPVSAAVPAPARVPVSAAPIAEWAAKAGLGAGELGAIALPLEGGPPLLAWDAQRPLNPASTTKVLTTWAALSLLGADYRWQTSFHLRGKLEDGILRGDLVVRGGGDPKLVIEDLVEIIARLRAGGLERIDGDLVLDDSIFEPSVDDASGFDGAPWEPYNVEPFGAMMNFKSVRLVVRPLGRLVELSFDPDLDGVAIDSAVRLVPGPCRHGVAGLQVRDARGERGEHDVRDARDARDERNARGAASAKKPVVRVSGSYSAGCGEQGVFVSVLDHRRFVGALFGAAWKAAGGSWRGSTRIERGAAKGDPWFLWVSPRTLGDVVHDINKFSNNVMTRHLLLQLAAHAGQRPATVAHARELLRDWLRAKGIDSPALVIDNGSGLSRAGRLSAGQLASALRDAAHGAEGAVLRDSLPLAGIDGTMKTRLVGEPLAGRAWIKTGSLNEVRAIAGYVLAASGRMYAVALLANGPAASSSRTLQDAFLRWVHENG